jgi:hypothetical protein
MQNRNSEELFALVKGMTKCEKKNFHLYARRNVNNDNLKVVVMYKALNAMKQYDEKRLVSKLKGVGARQIPSLKVSLYNLLLDSLRIIQKEQDIALQLHQLMDHAKILYDKGLANPALKTLRRLKVLALKHHQISFAFQAVVLEKKIELVHGESGPEKIESLNNEMRSYSEELALIGQLSNQSMLLYGWYKRHGTTRNEADLKTLNGLFQLSPFNERHNSFYSNLYFLQARCYYYLAKKDHQLFFQDALEWVELFNACPQMKAIEPLQYFRGLVYLNEAALLNDNLEMLHQTTDALETSHDPFYFLIARLNLSLAKNSFNKELLKETECMMHATSNSERIIVLCHKASLLCANQKDHSRLIDFAHYGINVRSNSRPDLQYELRCLHAESHGKLGNVEVADYLRLAARRFRARNL